jgi:Raf kinase inhibitor-like YbhB/YbcL family protein
MVVRTVTLCCALLALPGCRAGESPTRRSEAAGARRTEESAMPTASVTLTSAAFASGDTIPGVHTCDGRDASPPLRWTQGPEGTTCWSLICDDPDAPGRTWVHWVLYDVPAETRMLPEGVFPREILENGGRQGKNDFGRIGYGGPCPPPGKPHRYYFKIYALDTLLGLAPRATKDDVEKAMKGHILAQGELMGTYKRR